jgi:amino acid transporter
MTNISSEPYVFSIGLMMSIFCLSGYDSAGQLGEETDDPEVNSPNGII